MADHRHREWRRFLEDHADFGAQQRDVLLINQNVFAIKQDFTLSVLLRAKVGMVFQARNRQE